jgi:hypothetical protein
MVQEYSSDRFKGRRPRVERRARSRSEGQTDFTCQPELHPAGGLQFVRLETSRAEETSPNLDAMSLVHGV